MYVFSEPNPTLILILVPVKIKLIQDFQDRLAYRNYYKRNHREKYRLNVLDSIILVKRGSS